jgi:hypothetical protein
MSDLYQALGPDTFTFIVGHSLGGGLAELASATSYFSHVVTFNSSPVHGQDIASLLQVARTSSRSSRSMAKQKLENLTSCGYQYVHPVPRKGRFSYRIVEKGDVLTPLRAVASLVGKAQLVDVRDYEIDLVQGSPLENHSMKAIACALRKPQ